MPKTLKLALAAAFPVLLLAGCSDFLKGAGLNTNPNQPTTATPDQLWVGAQVALMAQWENNPWTYMLVWAQQIAGVNRQWETYALYTSGTDQFASDGAWNQIYGPGGYRDLQSVVASETVTGNLRFRGEARVLEALWLGTAADIWGDVPFSTALSAAPTFDTQATVYTHVLALLDSAITDLGGAGAGPTATDFFFGNDKAKWIAAAHTLKARFYMHTARTSATVYSAAALANVLAETALGISSSATEWHSSHTPRPGEQNLWYSFQFSRASDVDPADVHISETKAAGEAVLLPANYLPNLYGNYYGSVTGHPLGDSVASFAIVNNSATEYGIVQYAENQMLRAEAQYRTGAITGALATLNAFRVSQGQAAVSPAPALDYHTLNAVLREKYIRLFFNVEVWNDYLRTCYPNIPLPIGANPNQKYVPARMPVGYTEQSANSLNVPPQPVGNPGNANDPKNLTTTNGATACFGQVNRPN